MSTILPIKPCMQDSVIMITTNLDGHIIKNSSLENNPFKNCGNIYEVESLLPYKNILYANFETKKLAINIFKQNHIIFQTINEFGIQFVITEWFINSPLLQKHANIKIKKELCCIERFSIIEQEVMYFMQIGAYSQKDLVNCCYQYGIRHSVRQIKYNIAKLYDKFEVNGIFQLLQSLNHHKLNKYAPLSIIKPNIYSA